MTTTAAVDTSRLISTTRRSFDITITPAMATAILDFNRNNRRISTVNYLKLSHAMSAGQWEYNGETIKISRTGILLDGQHRLMACEHSGVPFTTLMVIGLSENSQSTIDTGKSRSLADNLSMAGFGNTNSMAAIIKTFFLIETSGSLYRGLLNSANEMITVSDGLTYLAAHESDIVTATAFGHKTAKSTGLTARLAALAWHTFTAIDTEDADYFFDHLASGVGLDAGNPILALRERLRKNKEARVDKKMGPVEMMAITIKAWNRFRRGESVQILAYRPGGAHPEVFPEAI